MKKNTRLNDEADWLKYMRETIHVFSDEAIIKQVPQPKEYPCLVRGIQYYSDIVIDPDEEIAWRFDYIYRDDVKELFDGI